MSDGTETAASLDTALGPILKKILDARSDTVKDDDATKTKEADAVEEEASEALRVFMGPDGHLTKQARETLLGCLKETYRAGFPVLLEDAACRDDPERRRKAMARIRELNKLAGFPMKVRLSPLDASQLPAELPDILASLSSEDPDARLSEGAPFDEVVKAGCIPTIVELVRDSDHVEAQFEAAWILTNYASSETKYVDTIVAANALPALSEMLLSPFADSAELAVLALGNIASESVALRDAVVRAGAVENTAAALAEHRGDAVPPSFAEHATWALATMFRAAPRPPAPVLRPAVAALARLAADEHDATAANAVWALGFYTDGGEHVADVLAENALPAVVRLLDRRRDALDVPVVRLLANVACGDDDAAAALVATVALDRAGALLEHARADVRREACWMLANVAAAPGAPAQAVVDAPGLVPQLVAVALCAAETRAVRTEAHFALANLLLCAPAATLTQLVHMRDYVRALACNAAQSDDTAEACVRALARVQTVLERAGSFEAADRTFVAVLVESGADDVLRAIHTPELQDTIHTLLASLGGTETSQTGDTTSTTTTTASAAAPQPCSLDDIE